MSTKMKLGNLRSGTTTNTMLLRQNHISAESVKDLMQIKKMDDLKSIEPQILKNFFEIEGEAEAQSNTGPASLISRQEDNKDLHPAIKAIFNKLKHFEKDGALAASVEGLGPSSNNKGKKNKKQPLNLDEIAYLTSFCTLMAKAHLAH
jgi:hypothetical protein